MSQITLSEAAAPATPATGKVTLYAKTDGLLYSKDDAGTETALGGSAGSVATDAIWDAKGDLAVGTGANTASRLAVGTDGYALVADSAQATGVKWAAVGGTGTVTTVSVASANGFAGSVANATTTPAITLSTSITGLLKGNGTAISAASSGTDYAPATSGSAILKGDGSGGFSSAAAGTDYQAPIGTISGIAKGNGANALTAATDGTDYLSSTTGVKQGVQTIYIPAAAMVARTTGGAAAGSVESSTNKIMLKTMDFADGASVLYAQFSVRMPKSWNAGTVTAQFTWTANSTSTNSVVWGIQGVSIGNDETIDAAFGTAQTVADANTATAYQAHISNATSAVTIGSSPAAQDWVVFQVYRDPTDGSDTLAATALLIGVTLNFTTNAANDA